MKKIVVVLVSLAVSILVIVGNVFAQDKISKASIPDPPLGPEWKLVAKDFDGSTLYINTGSITHLPEDIVEVWISTVPKGETRRKLVDIFKKVFFKGKDPNKTERLWYYNTLYKFNCKKHQWAISEVIFYSFEQTVLEHKSAPREEWKDIVPGSVYEGIEKYVCKSEASIPEPSLGSEWELVVKDPNVLTSYINTRNITPLPGGIVKVWELWVPRGELRKKLVNILKNYFLSKGEDPNKAERLWFFIEFTKINCRTHKVAYLKEIYYSFEKVDLDNVSYQPVWEDIIPGSAGEDIEKFVCKKHK